MTSLSRGIQPKKITLVTVPEHMDLTEALLETMGGILAREAVVVLILSIRPVRHFVAKAKDSGLDMDAHMKQGQLLVIDCVSRHIADPGDRLPSTFYVSSPSDLSELAMMTSEAISSAEPKRERWLVIDSISTLTLYNTAGGILRFLHFLTSKLRVLEFGGAIIVVRDEISDPMVKSLKQYCDVVMDIESEKPRR